ncbi:EF-hand domain-containing protein [Streptomyces sp. NBC_00102]|uniref:EF-hand domain-containing protein n=1 Tax=Streptomyces sp. NBC_00102 TaxID=2975652 RepID=UPI0022512876|nr:EF-hand domain-containing protein [Streptomyces sp. NBC_00102]MCX5399125.1 EF-hand domain-containing protein [Streptomyces sp. NBC_00102]
MSKLTEEEAKELFSEIDKDNNGTIRLGELRDYGQANEGKLDGLKLADFVRAADADGDRRITREEFAAYFA